MSLAPNAPMLEDWITVAEAADILGVTKQGVHGMIKSTALKTLHKIGSRPVYVVRSAEVHKLHDKREASKIAVEDILEAKSA